MAISPKPGETIALTQLRGLRSDCRPVQVEQGESPFCQDVAFEPGAVFTREALSRTLTAPATNPITWHQEMTCADGSKLVLALDAKGLLYKVVGGSLVQIGSTVAGAQVSAIDQDGRMYMAFSDGQRGVDAPRQYDPLKNVFSRVSQDGPAQAPILSNFTIPSAATSSLQRAGGVVTAVTTSAHGLSVGMRAQLTGTGYALTGGGVTSVVIDNEANPGSATITTAAPHGLLPGVSAQLLNVPGTLVGGGVTETLRYGNILTVTMAAAHGLQPGAMVQLAGTGGDHTANGIFEVQVVTSPTQFQLNQTGTNGSSAGGTVTFLWAGSSETAAASVFQVQSAPTPTTFTISISYPDGTWTGGSVYFDWDGTFYVTAVLSPTSLSYKQPGPDSVSPVQGVLTPQGQIAPGTHQVVAMNLTNTGYWTAPSPPVQFTADGSSFCKADEWPIGPSNIVARGLAFTGANGSKFFMLTVPGQIAGQVVSTSTVLNDNTSTSAIFDFGDPTLLSAQGIDIPGNNLFAQVTLEPCRGVSKFADRLVWWGARNTISNLLNMGFEGGVLATAPALPLGWSSDGTAGALVAGDFGLGWQITTGGTGQISQPAYQDWEGVAILQPNTLYTFRFWAEGSATAGLITANLFGGGKVFAAAQLAASTVLEGQFYEVTFSAPTGAIIPSDARLEVLISGLVGTVVLDEMSVGYAQNPYRNPVARLSYVLNPEAYDGVTGNLGPEDDVTAFTGLVPFSESTAVITTERAAYTVMQQADAEPANWGPRRIADQCGMAATNALLSGMGWAMWGGVDAAWLYTGFLGMLPTNASNGIRPNWQAFTPQWAVNDHAQQRVYFGGVQGPATGSGPSQQTVWLYDYHEGIQSGKWCPWNVPAVCGALLSSGMTFAAGSNLYGLDITKEQDDDFGAIESAYVPAPFAVSGFRKLFTYLIARVSGDGQLAVQQYIDDLQTVVKSTRAYPLANASEATLEWGLNISARFLFLKFAPNGRFRLEEITVAHRPDPVAQVAGRR